MSTYLTALGNTNAGKFNAAGRGFPDIAAQGVNVEIVSGGRAELVDGTSCSSPIFSSIVSLINDRLIAAGKPVLGFLNPLYGLLNLAIRMSHHLSCSQLVRQPFSILRHHERR